MYRVSGLLILYAYTTIRLVYSEWVLSVLALRGDNRNPPLVSIVIDTT